MKKLYIVDDDEAVLEIVNAILSPAGYETVMFASATQFLKKLDGAKPDLFIFDIMMPEIDGITLCRKIKNSAHSEVPVVMFSAKMSPLDKQESFNAGASGFITKPFTARELVCGIKTYLELLSI